MASVPSIPKNGTTEHAKVAPKQQKDQALKLSDDDAKILEVFRASGLSVQEATERLEQATEPEADNEAETSNKPDWLGELATYPPKPGKRTRVFHVASPDFTFETHQGRGLTVHDVIAELCTLFEELKGKEAQEECVVSDRVIFDGDTVAAVVRLNLHGNGEHGVFEIGEEWPYHINDPKLYEDDEAEPAPAPAPGPPRASRSHSAGEAGPEPAPISSRLMSEYRHFRERTRELTELVDDLMSGKLTESSRISVGAGIENVASLVEGSACFIRELSDDHARGEDEPEAVPEPADDEPDEDEPAPKSAKGHVDLYSAEPVYRRALRFHLAWNHRLDLIEDRENLDQDDFSDQAREALDAAIEKKVEEALAEAVALTKAVCREKADDWGHERFAFER